MEQQEFIEKQFPTGVTLSTPCPGCGSAGKSIIHSRDISFDEKKMPKLSPTKTHVVCSTCKTEFNSSR